MQKVVVKMSEENTIINQNLKEYNLALTIKLTDLWAALEKEVSRYTGDVYLYIQTDYIIPIKKPIFSFSNSANQLTATGGVTEIFKWKEIGENKQVTVNAVYAGTYDDTREKEIVSHSKIWLCELEQYISEQGEEKYEIISQQAYNATTDPRNGKRGIRGLFSFGFFRKYFHKE